jgi:hypothetical protein
LTAARTARAGYESVGAFAAGATSARRLWQRLGDRVPGLRSLRFRLRHRRDHLIDHP